MKTVFDEVTDVSEITQQQHALADTLAGLVVASLIDEATLTPKPGLVDMRSRGAHHDLSWSLMCDSAWALRPEFYAMALAGLRISERVQLRESIGQSGRAAEARMLQVTGGVNTHRGAIWALGLLVTAAAQALAANRVEAVTAKVIARRAGVLAQTPDQYAPLYSGNKGEAACAMYDVGGARAQAQAGFPQVLANALPWLISSRERGDKETHARLNALLAVIAVLDDTCVLSRAGLTGLTRVQSGAARILSLGGAASAQGKIALTQFEADLLALHVSPGGAADLLAATLFLDRIVTLVVAVS